MSCMILFVRSWSGSAGLQARIVSPGMGSKDPGVEENPRSVRGLG